jgi:hypothetical protein
MRQAVGMAQYVSAAFVILEASRFGGIPCRCNNYYPKYANAREKRALYRTVLSVQHPQYEVDVH